MFDENAVQETLKRAKIHAFNHAREFQRNKNETGIKTTTKGEGAPQEEEKENATNKDKLERLSQQTIITLYFNTLFTSLRKKFFFLIYMHFSTFTYCVHFLHTVSKGLERTHNIPTLRRMLGQNRKLCKENKCSKDAIKKYLHKTVAE